MRQATAVLLPLLLALGCTGALEDDGQPGGASAFPPGTAGTEAAGVGAQAGAAGPTAGASGPFAGAGAAGAGAAGAGIGGGAGAGVQSCADKAPDAGGAPLPRLSGLEYQLTLQDLFRLASPPDIESIPADTTHHGFKSYAGLQTVSAQHLRGYLDVATRLAGELLADPARRMQVIGCALDAPGCFDSFVTSFGKLAYRRPLEANELSAITSAATTNALDTEDQYRYAIEALLISPSFLYRVEVGDGSDAASPLGPYELASRLSFTLWGRAPSEALLDQAASGALDTPAGLEQVVTSMVADPRAQLFLESFFVQWLGYEQLRTPRMPAADWDDALMADMALETDRVVADYAWGGRDFLDVLTTNTTRLTPALASYYGLPAPAADGVVEIPAGDVRANSGLLTHASLISAKSDGDTIAKRGNWVRSTFLCRNLEVPPEIAETFDERLVGLTRTQIVRERNTDPQCAGCHAMIDPIGVGYEAFDETGRYREGVDITPFGITPGLPDAADPEFSSIAELAGKLREMPDVAMCLADRLFLYTRGRDPTLEDGCAVRGATEAFVGAGHDLPSLLVALVQDPNFRLRRPPEVSP